jgi:hypothetical protein
MTGSRMFKTFELLVWGSAIVLALHAVMMMLDGSI